MRSTQEFVGQAGGVAQQILDGSYEPPPGTSDSVVLLLDEISRIGQMIKRGAVRLTITAGEFREYWRVVNEGTSSSFSTIHFGHYKSAAYSPSLSDFLARKITLIARCGCPPERWGHGLQVLLEKIAGVALVSKLRAILLMEADFNANNKELIGSRMMANIRSHGLMMEEIGHPFPDAPAGRVLADRDGRGAGPHHGP